MAEEQYILIHRVPTLEEYTKICDSVGWSESVNFEVVEESLAQSLYSVVIQYMDKVVGMGRVIGDGKIYFYIEDVAVVAEHQNKGVGTVIVNAIIEYLRENAPEKAFVGLFASKGKEAFYNKYGFNNQNDWTGMYGVMFDRVIK